MRIVWYIMLGLLPGGFSRCRTQPSYGTNQLRLSKTIPMPGVKGRVDHLDINLRDQQVYVAALGNNTVEVVDLAAGRVVRSIGGLDEPQGVGYVPQTGEVIVANGGSGDCYFFDAHTWAKVATVPLGSDADDVRVDSGAGRVYVGYGSGGIAVIDAVSHKQVGDIKLPGHPESFQLDKGLGLLFVNVPDAHMVGVVGLEKSLLLGKWENKEASANFPMALDTARHRVLVGYRHPPKLLIYDGRTGKVLGSGDMTGDSDDLYFDDATGKIFVSGGAGAVSVFWEDDRAQQAAGGRQGKSVYRQLANIPTRSGARTSLLVPGWQMLVVAARAASGEPAGLLIYKYKSLTISGLVIGIF